MGPDPRDTRPTRDRSAATVPLLPRGRALPVPAASVGDVWGAAAGPADTVTVAVLVQQARADLGRPWPWPSARAFARYWRDGDRMEYEAAVRGRQQRLSRAAVLAAVQGESGDPAALDEVADGVTALCEQSTWCWPAHDDTNEVRSAVVPTVTAPFLDLGAGEVVGQLAWVDHLLGDLLDDRYPGLRDRIRHEAAVRVLRPFVGRRDWHWIGTPGDVHNWNPWIHGNVILAGLQLAEDAERGEIVALCLEGLQVYVDSFPADGAVDEGVDYWWNGALRALEALAVLRHASGGELGAVPDQLSLSVAFPHRMHLGRDWYVNLADASARAEEDLPWQALHEVASQVGDEDARRHAAAHRVPGTPVASAAHGLGRLLRALVDPGWASATGRSPLPQDSWFGSTQVLLARSVGGSGDGLSMASKGGHNGENHNHNDVGSFVVALRGVPVVVDAGRPTYSAATFGPQRYDIWTMQSDWHNVPQVRGTGQAVGADHAAHHVEVQVGPDLSGTTMDLAAAYDRDDIRSWRRRTFLHREAGQVRVEDTWDLAPMGGASQPVLHLLLAGQVEQVGAGLVVTALEGAGLVRVGFDPEPASVRLTPRVMDDPVLSRVWGENLVRVTVVPGGGASGSMTTIIEEEQ